MWRDVGIKTTAQAAYVCQGGDAVTTASAAAADVVVVVIVAAVVVYMMVGGLRGSEELVGGRSRRADS